MKLILKLKENNSNPKLKIKKIHKYLQSIRKNFKNKFKQKKIIKNKMKYFYQKKLSKFQKKMKEIYLIRQLPTLKINNNNNNLKKYNKQKQ